MDRIEPLRLFVRLAARGSFSAAARDLRIKQSTASKWVAELESELGVTLVERTTRSLRLTDAGRALKQRAVEVVAAVDALGEALSEQGAEPTGAVRVSVPVVFGRLFVAPALVPFLAKHPHVQAELVFNDRYVNLVEEGFGLAVRVGIPADTSAKGRKLADGQRCLVAAPEYVKARGQPATPNDLRGHECLVHGAADGGAVWRFRRGGAKETPFPVRGRVAANNSEAVLEMARGGLGVALLADWLVADDLERGTLVRLLAAYEAPPAPVYALTPGKYAPPAVRALLEHLSATLTPRLRAVRGGRRAQGADASGR